MLSPLFLKQEIRMSLLQRTGPTNKNNYLSKQTWLFHDLSDKMFKGTVVNPTIVMFVMSDLLQRFLKSLSNKP